MKKRLLAAALAACLTLALMPVRALAAGHRVPPVTAGRGRRNRPGWG